MEKASNGTGPNLHHSLVSFWCFWHRRQPIKICSAHVPGKTQHMSHSKRREFITHKATAINIQVVDHLPNVLEKKFDSLKEGTILHVMFNTVRELTEIISSTFKG